MTVYVLERYTSTMLMDDYTVYASLDAVPYRYRGRLVPSDATDAKIETWVEDQLDLYGIAFLLVGVEPLREEIG